MFVFVALLRCCVVALLRCCAFYWCRCAFVNEIDCRCVHQLPIPNVQVLPSAHDAVAAVASIASPSSFSLHQILSAMNYFIAFIATARKNTTDTTPAVLPPPTVKYMKHFLTATQPNDTNNGTMPPSALQGLEKSQLVELYNDKIHALVAARSQEASSPTVCAAVGVAEHYLQCLSHFLTREVSMSGVLHETAVNAMHVTKHVFYHLVPRGVYLRSRTIQKQFNAMKNTIQCIANRKNQWGGVKVEKEKEHALLMFKLIKNTSLMERTVSYCCSLVHKFDGYSPLVESLLRAEYGEEEEEEEEEEQEEQEGQEKESNDDRTKNKNTRSANQGSNPHNNGRAETKRRSSFMDKDEQEDDAVRWQRWEKNKQRNDGAIFLEDEESRESTRHAMAAITMNRRPSLDVPDVKEYIVRCVASAANGASQGSTTAVQGKPEEAEMPIFSTCHRMYVMLETKTNHIRFACALSESE